MPAHTSGSAVPLLAVAFAFAGMLAAVPHAAFAFSQIGAEDGSTTQRDGIISVPLPPLGQNGAIGEDGAIPGGETTGTTGTTPGAAPADGKARLPPSGEPASRPPEDPVDPGSTDEGETELPIDPGEAPATGAPAGETQGEAAPAKPLAADPASPDDPSAAAPNDDPASDDQASPDETAPEGDVNDAARPVAPDETLPPAQILYGEEGLPKPVRDLRETLIAIAKTGNIEALRPYIEPGDEGTVLTFGGTDGDPIAYLKSASGDGEGVEILAILLEVLQAGHIRSEPATDDEIFVWPYFTGVPIDKLTNSQKVELFELVTAGDYQEMLGFGAYNFYRVGISPDGKLQFFVAGD